MNADRRIEESFQGLSDDAFLRKAYLSLLGRLPDPSGAAGYMGRLRAGISKQQVWDEISSADEAKRFAARAPLASSAAASARPLHDVGALLMLDGADFVRAAYREILGRQADPAGLRDYTAKLSSGVAKEQIVADLRSDPEGQAFGASLEGLDQLVQRVQKRADIVEAPSSLDELLALHGEVFIRAAYLVLFKREPDVQGLHRYLELLRAGYSNMFILKALYQAPEAKEKLARLDGLRAALKDYDKAQLRSWTGWYNRSVKGALSELPRDRELRALAFRLSQAKK